MSKEPSVEEAIARARRVQENRIEAIRALGTIRVQLGVVRDETTRELEELQASITARVRDAENSDVRAYNAAISAGWTPDELRQIGYAEPDKKKRTRSRAVRRKTGAATAPAPVESAHNSPGNVEQSEVEAPIEAP